MGCDDAMTAGGGAFMGARTSLRDAPGADEAWVALNRYRAASHERKLRHTDGLDSGATCAHVRMMPMLRVPSRS